MPFKKNHKINNGRSVSLETKLKMSLAQTGKKKTYPAWNKGKKGLQTHTVSEEAKKKIGEANKINTKKLWQDPKFRENQIQKRKGKPSWNKGISPSEETKKKISAALMGRTQTNPNSIKNLLNYIRPKGTIPWNKGSKYSEKEKENLNLSGLSLGRAWNKGEKLSEEHIKKLKIGHIGKQAGEKHPNWKGGITPINNLIRSSAQYREWRQLVLRRDNYTCQICGVRGGKLHADHIKKFSDFKDLRFDINNGRALCVPCHKNTDTYGSKKIKKNVAA